MWQTVFNWLLSFLPQIVTFSAGVKTVAETVDTVKKLAPPQLEGKATAQEFVTTTVTMLNDEKTVEEKKWEIETRKELVDSLIRAETVEASYNIARYAIFTTFTAFIFHLLVRMVTQPRRTD